jgi:hypothetical protein
MLQLPVHLYFQVHLSVKEIEIEAARTVFRKTRNSKPDIRSVRNSGGTSSALNRLKFDVAFPRFHSVTIFYLSVRLQLLIAFVACNRHRTRETSPIENDFHQTNLVHDSFLDLISIRALSNITH